MKRCPITYEAITDGDYSAAGLKLLDGKLQSLAPLPYTAEEQREQAIERVGKMSIQGVQLKLSAVLKVKHGRFDIVDRNGRYILKPQSKDFPELPENEDLTMRMAAAVNIEVPLHGLVYGRDRSLTYFVKRFDRIGRSRIPVEDFAQLSGASRDTKYESSMEKVAKVINDFCTFPRIEQVKLFQRVLFSFLVGNEDMHLKNFSLITRTTGRVDLSPAYDFLNSIIAIPNAKEEMASPIRGKRAGLTRSDLLDYFPDRLGINVRVREEVISSFTNAFPIWDDLLAKSFLSDNGKEAYAAVLKHRQEQLRVG